MSNPLKHYLVTIMKLTKNNRLLQASLKTQLTDVHVVIK